MNKSDTFTPPQAVRDNARRALDVREAKPSSQQGMTAVGLKRANDLANGRSLSYDTIKRMKAYFDRHQKDKQGSTWREQGKGWQAWMGWGGDEGWAWAKGIINEVEGSQEPKRTNLSDKKKLESMTKTLSSQKRKLKLSEKRGGSPGVSWVFALSLGKVHVERPHGDRDVIDVTEDLVRTIVEDTRLALSNFEKRAPKGGTPYKFPILSEHNRNGEQLGHIIDVEFARNDGKDGLWVLVSWDDVVYKDIQRKKRRHVSVGLAFNYFDDAGVEYRVVLNELSLTATPRVKSIGSLQDTLYIKMSEKEVYMEEDKDKQEMSQEEEVEQEEMQESSDAEEIAEMLALLKDSHVKLMEVLAFVKELYDAMKPKEVDASEDSKEEEEDKEELSERVAKLEKALSKRKGLNLSEQVVQSKPTELSEFASFKKATGLSGREAVEAFASKQK